MDGSPLPHRAAVQGVPKNQAGPPLPLPACPPWAAPCRAALVGAEGTDGCLSLLPPQCEWLLGDRKPSPEELDQGIDPDSPLFRAILDNPVVQLGLTNPKTLLGTCAPLTLAGEWGAGRRHCRGTLWSPALPKGFLSILSC